MYIYIYIYIYIYKAFFAAKLWALIESVQQTRVSVILIHERGYSEKVVRQQILKA